MEENNLSCLKLVFPKPCHKELWQGYMKEFADKKEKVIPYGMRIGDGTFESFLALTEKYHEGRELPDEHVPATTYFLMNENEDEILGAVNIRHHLKGRLLVTEGNIGYGIRPYRRKMGLASKMLALALEECRALGLVKVLVTCNNDNIGSEKVILKNGGVLENEFLEENGNTVKRYWIIL